MGSQQDGPSPVPSRVALLIVALGVMGGAFTLFGRASKERPSPVAAPDLGLPGGDDEEPASPTATPPRDESVPAPKVAAPDASAPTDSPPDEEAYLLRLRELNLTDKERALALAEQGDDWYSDEGRAAEARKAMAITLLVDLQRMPEARQRTREFIRKYPDSPYRRLVQGVTGIHPRPAGPTP